MGATSHYRTYLKRVNLSVVCSRYYTVMRQPKRHSFTRNSASFGHALTGGTPLWDYRRAESTRTRRSEQKSDQVGKIAGYADSKAEGCRYGMRAAGSARCAKTMDGRADAL